MAPILPDTLEELKEKCSQQLLEELQVPLSDASPEQITQSFLQILCRMDALEDRYDSKTLHILHFNDCYNLTPKLKSPPLHHAEAYGGFARFSTILKEEITKCGDSKPMILFSGDFVGDFSLGVRL